MNRKKTQKIENQSYISTNDFINFKKEIKEELEELRKKNLTLEEKLSQTTKNILDIQKNTNNQFNEILNEIKNIPKNRKSQKINNKTDISHNSSSSSCDNKTDNNKTNN